MAIITTWSPSVSNESTSMRIERADERAQDFAGMFAGAVQAPREKPEPKKPEGTSELDGPEKPEETSDTEGTKKSETEDDKKPKRKKVAVASSNGEVVQTTTVLDPELQAKLARVMQRMQDETGKDVKVAETFRTQERQNALFAQGRETPGQVVTWTTNSKHTQGRAVDLVVDGASNGFDDAYQTLQRIANEEGLRTLGAKDPGHIELPGTGPNLSVKSVRAAVTHPAGMDGLDTSGQIKAATTSNAPVKPFTTNGLANEGTPMASAAPADASGQGQVSISRLTQVAQVAEVAVVDRSAQVAAVDRPAQVARVATVARVGGGEGANNGQSVHSAGGKGANNGQAVHAAASVDGAQSASIGGKSSSKRFSGESGEQGNGGGERGGYSSALAAAVAMRDSGSSNAGLNGVANTYAVSSAERAAEVIAALQDAPARPLSQITMSVDAGNGLADKVQISMRGSQLSATIDASDAQRATTMNSRSDELVRALSRDGIDVESLRVRAAAGAAVTASATPSQSSNDSQSSSRFEQKNPWQQQDRQRSQDDRRQQQQRQQRRGQAE